MHTMAWQIVIPSNLLQIMYWKIDDEKNFAENSKIIFSAAGRWKTLGGQ